MKNFLINLCVVTAAAGIISFFVNEQLSPIISFRNFISPLCIFFFLITSGSYYFIVKQEAPATNSSFVNRYLMVTAAKFILSVSSLVIFALLAEESPVGFILLFAFYYLLFTTFEVVSLMKYFKGKD